MSRPGPAVVLLSGGLDSATCLYLARERGHRLYALSFEYGQRHHHELAAAGRVAAAAGVAEHRVCRLDLGWLGGSSLLGDGEVAKDRDPDAIGRDIPRTYVPARNTIFLAQALAWAEVLDARDIVIGANHVDYSGYPDCRPEYLRAFERLARLATRAGVEGSRLRIHAPLLELDKADIVRLGHELGVDFALTHSCYDPDAEGRACGRCDACQLRLRGFAQAGHPDPARYRPGLARPDRS